MGGTLNFQPDLLQTLKPLVRRSLIANLAPDPFLEIQSRLVRGQILQVQSGMGLNEEVHRVPLMPASPIHVEPDRVTSKTLIQMSQTVKKSFPVALRRWHHPSFSQQGSDPPKQIQSLPVLAGRGNPQSLSHLGPSHPQARMEGEPGLILEYDRLPRLQGSQFFLRPGEIAELLRSWLADSNTQPASGGSPTGASRTGPAGPSR